MKNLPAFLLLAILLVNSAGFYVFYGVELTRIHHAMRAQIKTLPDHLLTRIALTHEAFKASRVEDDEIKVHGKMYDVGRMQVRTDSVIVFALHDEKEENLIAFIEEIITKPFNHQEGVDAVVLSYSTLNFLPGQRVSDFVSYGCKVVHCSRAKKLIPLNVLLQDYPPPR